MSILVVENDSSWIAKFRQLLPDLLSETAAVHDVDSSDHLTSEASLRIVQAAHLALVDLELGAGTGNDASDFDGRDRVLPLLREHAPWLPAVLVTRYLTGDPIILAELSPSDFDAVLPKEFFSNPATNAERWKKFRRSVALRRIGCMTGRSVMEVEACLETPVVLDYGRAVENELKPYGLELAAENIRLMGFGSSRIVLDTLIMGFSGLSVLRATCSGDGFRTRWLIKCGTKVAKLQREARAHRQMTIEGLTRQFSVPLFRHMPVVWKGFGSIAYEFEEGAKTLLDFADESGVDAALEALLDPMRRFYQEGRRESVVPLAYLESLISKTVKASDPGLLHSVLEDLISAQGNDGFSDRSMEVRASCQHGDCHARNILVGKHGAVMIDFANYVSRADRGIPLLDIAKLATDLFCFTRTPWAIKDLVTGEALTGPLLEFVRKIGALIGENPTSDEKQLFAWASICHLTRYFGYPDVPADRKRLIAAALGFVPD